MLPPSLPYTIDELRSIEPVRESIELGNGDRIIGEPHKPLVFRHHNRGRHLFLCRSGRVHLENVVLDWNMSLYRQWSTLFRFASNQVINEVTLRNVIAVNTAETWRSPGLGDCWVVNFTNRGGLDGVTVENCESWWSNCQLTAGGHCRPDRGVFDVSILESYVRGGRSNSIAVSGWGGQKIEHVKIEGCHVRYGANGCFVGRDGGENRGDVRLSNVHLRNNLFVLDQHVTSEVHSLGGWSSKYPKAALFKGGTHTGVRRIYSSGNVFDSRAALSWQRPRWLDVSGPYEQETQVWTNDRRLGNAQDAIRANVQYV